MEQNYYSYISSRANWDCIQTIFLCAPAKVANNNEKLCSFVKESGWEKVTEEKGAVLIAPMVKKDWQEKSLSLIPEFYEVHKNDFKAPSGISIPGREGVLWLWETMIYLVGYGDGADYAANVLIKEPGFFAASALIDGVITDFSHSKEEASHWFVRKPHNYQKKNNEIASSVWLFKNQKDSEATIEYFKNSGQMDGEYHEAYDGVSVTGYFANDNPAVQLRISDLNEANADVIADYFFEKTLRWKNGPDGQLRNYMGRRDYERSERFIHREVSVNGNTYPYTVHMPEGMNKEDVKDLPLVFSLHGRGEPTWVFAEKNGWDVLSDRTREFIVVFPDSPYNIWTIERDLNAIPAILKQVSEEYQIDKQRVYLSGFSNGAVFTCQIASTFPDLFAAASPWNGPEMEMCQKIGLGSYYYHPDFVNGTKEMPFWIIVGDSDSKASACRDDELKILLPVDHCTENYEVWNGENHYTKKAGYLEGDRFETKVFFDQNGSIKVGLTVMANMPHGAIWDESYATWVFMRRFARVNGEIEEIKEDR